MTAIIKALPFLTIKKAPIIYRGFSEISISGLLSHDLLCFVKRFVNTNI